jgi:hypothetical protein
MPHPVSRPVSDHPLPAQHEFEHSLQRRGEAITSAPPPDIPNKTKQRLFAAFEITVGTSALTVGSLGLFYTLNPKDKEEEKERNDQEQVRILPIVWLPPRLYSASLKR